MLVGSSTSPWSLMLYVCDNLTSTAIHFTKRYISVSKLSSEKHNQNQLQSFSSFRCKRLKRTLAEKRWIIPSLEVTEDLTLSTCRPMFPPEYQASWGRRLFSWMSTGRSLSPGVFQQLYLFMYVFNLEIENIITV